MRRTLGTVGALALMTAGVVACGSPSISDANLGFTIVEGLLLVDPAVPEAAQVILASTSGNCHVLQQGAVVTQIGGTDFLTFELESLDSQLNLLPIDAGSYTITLPSATGPTSAGLYALSVEYETDLACNASQTGAASGTVTVEPFHANPGGTSDVTYSVVFGYSRFKGSYPLSTCVTSIDAGDTLDAGTCLPPQ